MSPKPSLTINKEREGVVSTLPISHGVATRTPALLSRILYPGDIGPELEADNEFMSAWHEWLEHLDQLTAETGGCRPTRRTLLTTLMEARRVGPRKTALIIRYSISKNAKNILWDAERDKLRNFADRLKGRADGAGAAKRILPGIDDIKAYYKYEGFTADPREFASAPEFVWRGFKESKWGSKYTWRNLSIIQ